MSFLDELPISRKQAVSIVQAVARCNIWEGAIRSGKTIASILCWLIFLSDPPAGGQFVMVGRTRESLARNVIEPMRDPALFGRLAGRVSYTMGAPTATILGRRVYMLGASDAKAEMSLRGLTVAGAYVDEITVIRPDFFRQLLGRMSLDDARLFGSTNPDNPVHWLKREFLDRIGKTDADSELLLPDWRTWHFELDDNPALSEKRKLQYKREYSGLWYRRFILGHWVAADGSVFDSWAEHLVVEWAALPLMRKLIAVGIDYGTTNPTHAVLLGLGVDGVLYAVDEYRYEPSTMSQRKTDAELSTDLCAWLDQPHLPDLRQVRMRAEHIIADPSAASLRVQLRSDGIDTAAADNDVLYGLRVLAMLFARNLLRISTRCPALLLEIPGYSWSTTATEEGQDAPIKVNDHGIDALRYAVITTERLWRPLIGFDEVPDAA
ncbi:PBSX family phage terminase large subunit [Nocardia iowensis]|uniref:PBSX family phage terminase large subunit n=1 Tax=Nocardia iowensis TaxID=204891 RepID=A0ABX8RLU8_NOCIO|nr:PBSX family phage terminase large subunit [Nocardia iowensis]QXN90276.1 PBSX family phage terminase large subunit [Nocardia iowensis]